MQPWRLQRRSIRWAITRIPVTIVNARWGITYQSRVSLQSPYESYGELDSAIEVLNTSKLWLWNITLMSGCQLIWVFWNTYNKDIIRDNDTTPILFDTLTRVAHVTLCTHPWDCVNWIYTCMHETLVTHAASSICKQCSEIMAPSNTRTSATHGASRGLRVPIMYSSIGTQSAPQSAIFCVYSVHKSVRSLIQS